MAATCTVVVSGDGRRCGRPAVTSFTTRGGVTYHECAEHAMPTPAASVSQRETAEHPPTRTTRSYVLVADGRIVGYADAVTAAVERRAARLGARVVPVVR